MKVGEFARIKTDEGKEVVGFGMIHTYEGSHHSDYSGTILADFSEGHPFPVTVLDTDYREKKDGLHVFNLSKQVTPLSRDEGIKQIALAKQNLLERLKRFDKSSTTRALLESYLSNLANFENWFRNGRQDHAPFTILDTHFDNTESRFFVGYEYGYDDEVRHPAPRQGICDAPLKPEEVALKGVELQTPLKRHDLSDVYHKLTQRLFNFWPVSSDLSGNKTLDKIAWEIK